jgi:hypothetical protein
MKSTSVIVVAALLCLSVSATANGQLRGETLSNRLTENRPIPAGSASAAGLLPAPTSVQTEAAPGSVGRIAAATTAGAVIGGAAGFGIVALTRGEPADGNMFPAGDLLAGTIIGAIPGMYIGARMGSGRSGNPWLTGAAAVGGTALGLMTGAVVGAALSGSDTGKAPELFGVALAVAIPVSLTAYAEARGGRAPR